MSARGHTGLAPAAEPARDVLGVLAAARIAFASVLLARTTPLFGLTRLAAVARDAPLLGWPAPGWTLTLGPRLPAAVVSLLCVVRTAAALALLVGLRARVAAATCGAAGIVVAAQDLYGWSNTLALLYLGALVLAATDCGARVAITPAPPRAPGASRALVRAFVASVYAWAAFAKLDRDWLAGVTLGALRDEGRVAGPLAGVLLATGPRCIAAAWTVLAVETALPPLLLAPRTRRLGLALAVAFHLGLELVARPDAFGFAMLALLAAFLEPGRGPVEAG